MEKLKPIFCLLVIGMFLVPSSTFAKKFPPSDCPLWDPAGERGLGYILENLDYCIDEYTYVFDLKMGQELAFLKGREHKFAVDPICFNVETNPDNASDNISITTGYIYLTMTGMPVCQDDSWVTRDFDDLTDHEIKACMFAIKFLGKDVLGEMLCP